MPFNGPSSNESVSGKDSDWTDKKDSVSFNSPSIKSPTISTDSAKFKSMTDNAPTELPPSGQAGYFPDPDDLRYLRQWTGSEWGIHRYLKQDLPESESKPYDPLDSPGPPVPAEQVVPRILPGGFADGC